MINYAEDPRIGVFLVDPSHKLIQDTNVKNPGLVIYKRDQKEEPIYKSGLVFMPTKYDMKMFFDLCFVLCVFPAYHILSASH